MLWDFYQFDLRIYDFLSHWRSFAGGFATRQQEVQQMTLRRRGLGIGSVPVGLLLKLPDDTSAPTASQGALGEYRVPELDQKKNGPHDLEQVEGAGQRTLWKESDGRPTTLFSKSKVIDVDQGTRTLPQTYSTPPWCQQRVIALWPFGGVFVFSAATRTSDVEGAAMM
ncbi:hypothetical protein ACIRRI_28155 [Streptomyces mirabilis]|uniref:hypothetical protein n=1 Tax=Streptomyces mirabilis TaxID=68239 RepID=UPI0038118BD3